MRAVDPSERPLPESSPISERKLAANRANALHSTGPRTAAGKAKSRLNALRHGLTAQVALLRGENARDLEAFGNEMETELRPQGPLEREVVARIVSIAWRLRRVARAEEALWVEDDYERGRLYRKEKVLRQEFQIPVDLPEDGLPPLRCTGGQFLASQFIEPGTSSIERLAVYEQRLDRSLHAAIRQLNQLRKSRANCSDEAQPRTSAPGCYSNVLENIGIAEDELTQNVAADGNEVQADCESVEPPRCDVGTQDGLEPDGEPRLGQEAGISPETIVQNEANGEAKSDQQSEPMQREDRVEPTPRVPPELERLSSPCTHRRDLREGEPGEPPGEPRLGRLRRAQSSRSLALPSLVAADPKSALTAQNEPTLRRNAVVDAVMQNEATAPKSAGPH